MKKYLVRTLSLLLIIALTVQLLPAAIFAIEENNEFPETEMPNEELSFEDEESFAIADEAKESAEVLFEETSLREETVKHFRMSDGSSVAVDYQQPVHYAAVDGTWKDIDNRLTATGDISNKTTAYISTIGDYQKTFAADLSKHMIFSVRDGQYQIAMGLSNEEETGTGDFVKEDSTVGMVSANIEKFEETASAAQSEIEIAETVPSAQIILNEELSVVEEETKSIEEQTELPNLSASVVYEDALQGADLQYESIGYDVKESIVVSAPQTSYTYCFTLSLTNLTAHLLENGSISIRGNEEEMYYIPAPYMVDANEAYSDAAYYTLEDTGGGTYLLTVTADSAWLNAEDRVFPVQIDPTLCKLATGSNSVITNSFIRSANPGSMSSTYSYVYCGKSTSANTSGSVMGALQSYFYISSLPTLPTNSRIINSYLSLYFSGIHGSGELLIRAFELTGTPSSGTYSDWIKSFTWNNHSARSSTMLDAVDMTSKTLYEYVNWDITKAILGWYQNGSNNKGITLEANDATHLTSYASFGGYAHNANRPALYVVYRNAVGIEPYYTYQTQSAGRAGTAYVSDNNLQLTLLRTDLSIDSTVNPFSLTHVYNSAYGGNQFTDGVVGIQAKDYTNMVLGAGWKLSVQETVRRCTNADTATTYYVYNDDDGTEHYFYYDSQKGGYRDEDGLNLSLTISGTTYTITDEKNNKRIFYNGYLSEIRSANGNSIYVAYNESSTHTLSNFSPTGTSWRPAASGNRITSIYRKNNGEAVEWLVGFSWNSSNQLSSVTDKVKNRVTYFGYENVSGVTYLTEIREVNNNTLCAKYVYDTLGTRRMKEAYDVEAKRGIEYTYTGHTSKWDVYRMSEYYAASFNSEKTYGAKIRAYQFDPYSTSYRYYGNDRITSDDPANSGAGAAEDDLLSVLYFDALGRTVNTVGYNTNRAYILGGGVTSFTQNNGTSAKNNRVVAQASAGMFYANMLEDGGFEDGVVSMSNLVEPLWGTTNNGGDVVFYSGMPHSGEKYIALRIANTPSGSTEYQAGLYQEVPLQVGKTYCFSAYLRIDQENANWSYGNAYLYFAKSDGEIVSKGDEISFDTGEIDNGWMRVYVTYTPIASEEEFYRVGVCLNNVRGELDVDDLQLEIGAAPNSYNLLADCSAEFYATRESYKGWICSGGATIASASNTIDGAKAIQLSGHTGLDRYTYQDIKVSEDYNTTYLISGWAKAPSLPFDVKETYESTDRFFGLKARMYYVDGSSEATFIPFNCYCEDWQYVYGVLVPKQKKQVEKIRLYADYSHNAGTAYFDNIALTKEPVQTYSYDENGKIKAANDAGEEQSYTFTGADLTKCINSNGTFTFTYDAYHNLTTATNDNVTMRLTYDNAGNMTYSKLVNSEDDWFMQSSAAYTSNKNLVLASRDVNGNRTEYTYINGTLPQTVKDPQGHKTAYSYDSNLRTSSAKYYINDSTTAALAELYYSYSSGSLSQIRRKTGTNTWHHLLVDTDMWGNTTAIRINGSTNGTASGTGITLATYGYEPNNGKRSWMKYGNGSGVEYSYDILDRLVETRYYENYGTTSPLLTKTVYNAYNGLGILTETGTKNVEGKVTEKYVYEYDSLGRLIRSAEYAYTYSGSNVICTLVQRTEHKYDKDNRLSAQNWTIGSTDFSESYAYNEADGSLKKLETGAGSIDYTYDNLKRLQKATATNAKGNVLYNTAYAYRTVSGNQTSAQVEFRNVRRSSDNELLEGKKYDYDSVGNIIQISQSTGDYYPLVKYEYDSQNQLTKETYYDGTGTGTSHVTDTYEYTYDTAGNVLTVKENGTTIQTYTYSNGDWKDLLTAVNGNSIVYDNSGNPTLYSNGGAELDMSWTNGRQLSYIGCYDEHWQVAYSYNADGIRTQKIDDGILHKYITQNGKVARETIGSGSTAKVLDFIYDESGRPFALIYTDGTGDPETYYYILNQQGDVVKLIQRKETVVDGETTVSYPEAASYTYDAWGKILDATGSMADINPLRYRGYYYDTETGFYYLQSRYYDPMNHRFINADCYTSTDATDAISCNMFAYCCNNPVSLIDSSGAFPVCYVADSNDTGYTLYDRDAAIAYAREWYNSANTSAYASFIGKGGDCANFVSQCLVAGGIGMTSDWFSNRKEDWLYSLITNEKYMYSISSSWKCADDHYKYFSDETNPYTNGSVIQITDRSKIKVFASTGTVKPGDLLYFVVDGNISHATMVSSVDNGMIFFTGHSSQRYNYPLSKAGIGTKYAGVYIIRIVY